MVLESSLSSLQQDLSVARAVKIESQDKLTGSTQALIESVLSTIYYYYHYHCYYFFFAAAAATAAATAAVNR